MNSFSKTLFTWRSCCVLGCHKQPFVNFTTHSASYAISQDEVINVPKRILRGPTDILKALDKTVAYDMTGPHYKFHDDPVLSPFSGRTERLYLFAKESGQKAARWVRDQHPELFSQVIADPPIETYLPSIPINDTTVSEEMLIDKIRGCAVSDAIKVFETMQSINLKVSREGRQMLFELLCFYNCKDPVPMENVAERFYNSEENPQSPKPSNLWAFHPLVKSLFDSLEPQDSAAYSAYICGLYMYGARKEGDELLLEAKQKNICLDVHAYNAYLLRIISIYDTNDAKYEMCMEVLQNMNSQGVKPNLATLNAVMDVIGRLNRPGKSEYLPRFLKEFQNQGVEPSLGTFAFFIRSFNISEPKDFLDNYVKIILQSLKGKAISGRHLTDITFFHMVMSTCFKSQNIENAISCFEIAHSYRNSELLGGNRRRLQFYNMFLQLVSQKCSFDTLVKYYRQLVPHVYTPPPQFYKMVFELCDQNGSVELLADFWNDFYVSGGSDQETLLKILEVACNLSAFPVQAAYDARPKLGEMTKKFWEYLTFSEENLIYSRYYITPEMCGYLLILLAHSSNWRTIQSVLERLNKDGIKPNSDAIKKVLNSCLVNNNPDVAMWIIKYCRTNFAVDVAVVSDVLEKDFFNEEQKKEIRKVYGLPLSQNDSSSSSSSDSSSESESDSDSDTSDSDVLSIPRESKKSRK